MKRATMFNYYWDRSDFSIGFSIARPHRLTGYNWYISIDITWLSIWVYFNDRAAIHTVLEFRDNSK